MVEHEASILKWATMESDGITDGSLDDVIVNCSTPCRPPEADLARPELARGAVLRVDRSTTGDDPVDLLETGWTQ